MFLTSLVNPGEPPTFARRAGLGSVGADMARRRLQAGTLLLGVGLLALAACGNGSGGTAGRPSTAATLSIVQPTPNAVTGANVTLQLQLNGGTIAPVGSNLALVPNQGHIHLYLDNQLINMTQSLNQRLPTLTAGLHTVRAEFVANDHLPWNRRIYADVAFQVR